jgi:tetratricopeptide (TPR) repeat protein
VQDAAYVSLLRGRRQRIHADIAQVLKRRLADEEYPPAIIAHHFTEAGLPEPAAQNWLAAAELALSQSAPTEAEHHASAGLALIPRVTEGAERDALELGLLVARANALVPLKSISAPETYAAMTAAKDVLDRGVGTDLQRVSILAGLCAATTLMARMQPALELASQIIEVAERQDDPTYRLVAYRMMGTNQYYAGQNREALASLERGKLYREPRRQKAMSYRFGWDPSLSILCFEVLVRLSLGRFDSAARLSEKIRAEVRAHEHTTTVASATFCAGTWPKVMLGELDALERDSAALSAYCAERKVEQIRLLSNFHHVYAHAMREPIERNIVALRAALEAIRSSGGLVGSSLLISNLTEVSLTAGDLPRAEEYLQEGLSFVEQSGEHYWAADLHRLSGLLALRQNKSEAAEKCFVQAIDIAKGQGARLLELRAAVDLARLWHERTPERHPRTLLEPILADIEGGEATRDVRNARALLGQRA